MPFGQDRRRQFIPARLLDGSGVVFTVGARVRVNETFPYGRHGKTGTVIELPDVLYRNAGWLKVAFDEDGGEYPATWHHNYFDVITEAGDGQSPPPAKDGL